MPRSPWSRPASAPQPNLVELALARGAARALRPSMRVGYKTGLRKNIVAGINARLAGEQLVKVEFVKIAPGELDELVRAIEEGTASACVDRHGSTATFFRRDPERRFP